MRTDVEPEVLPRAISRHATAVVPRVHPSTTAGEALRDIQGRRWDTAEDLAVCEDERLVGLLRIEELLAARPDQRVAELMNAAPPMVGPGLPRDEAANRLERTDEVSLAVVDEDNRFLGLVTPHTLITVLLEEHENDLARMAGLLHDTSAARLTTEEPLARRVAHRIPWLIAGLGGALLAALLVGRFEQTIAETILLSFFLPGVVYLADAVGTQTETLVIRGLSVGVPIRRIVSVESLTGLVIGSILALICFPIVSLVWGETDVALVVSLAIVAASTVATLNAMLLPWLFHRSGRDPVFGSGPLATVIQDVVSIFVYLVIAAAIL
jgi:magnesium transporter